MKIKIHANIENIWVPEKPICFYIINYKPKALDARTAKRKTNISVRNISRRCSRLGNMFKLTCKRTYEKCFSTGALLHAIFEPD